MAVWWHPENKPFNFWKLEVVKSGEKRKVIEEIEDNGIYGKYKTLLEVTGNQQGGEIMVSSGWFDENAETWERWVDPETGEVGSPAIVIHSLPDSEGKPIAHFGSKWPTFSISLFGLLRDSVIK